MTSSCSPRPEGTPRPERDPLPQPKHPPKPGLCRAKGGFWPQRTFLLMLLLLLVVGTNTGLKLTQKLDVAGLCWAGAPPRAELGPGRLINADERGWHGGGCPTVYWPRGWRRHRDGTGHGAQHHWGPPNDTESCRWHRVLSVTPSPVGGTESRWWHWVPSMTQDVLGDTGSRQ